MIAITSAVVSRVAARCAMASRRQPRHDERRRQPQASLSQ
jgi:hypothetical protein